MDIKRSYLVKMVAEEVRAALREFSHGEDEPKKKGKGKRPETHDAGDEPSKADSKPSKDAKPVDEPPTEDPVAKGDGSYDTDDEDELDADPAELPGDDEMATDNVDAAEDEDDALDSDGDEREDDAEGQVNDVITGRTVGSLTMEPESDLLPGAREIVLTFSDSPDILRICVDDVGNIKYFLNGHDYDQP